MVTEIVQRGRLFLGSYAGLFALLAIRFDTMWLRWTCAGLAVIGVGLMLWVVFYVANRTGAELVVVNRVEDAGAEVAGYLATYLLPFLTVGEPSVRDVLAYAIFLAIGGLIYVRSEMTQVNPTLYLLGRRVVKVAIEGGWSGYVVVRSVPAVDGEMRVVSWNNQVRVEVRSKN